jgi:hypothetical protein
VLGIVLGQKLTIGLEQSNVDELVTLRFDAAEDFTREVSCHAIGLDEDKGFFNLAHDRLLSFLCSLQCKWRLTAITAEAVELGPADGGVNPKTNGHQGAEPRRRINEKEPQQARMKKVS